MNIYQENGYKDRMQSGIARCAALDYLTCLSEDYGCPLENVLALADVLTEAEDWDGLVSALEDYFE